MRPAGTPAVALVAQQRPEGVLAAAAQWLPRAPYPLQAMPTEWGTILVSSNDYCTDGALLVAGTPIDDPWGLPTRILPLNLLLQRFARYGPHVTQLVAGPFVVVDIGKGSLMSALNGIIPVFRAAGQGRVIGTNESLVSVLAGSSTIELMPLGAGASVDGAIEHHTALVVRESIRGVTVSSVHADVLARLSNLGLQRSRVPQRDRIQRGFEVYEMGAYSIAVPTCDRLELDGVGAPSESLRRDVSTLWWASSRQGRQAFFPLSERPALDLLRKVYRGN